MCVMYFAYLFPVDMGQPYPTDEENRFATCLFGPPLFICKHVLDGNLGR